MIKKLIAIDLSTTSTGVAIFMNGEYYKSRTIIPDKKLCVINRIYHIYRELKKVIDYPDMVVVEKALSLQNGDTTIKLAKLHGVLLSICMEQMVKLEEIDNQTWKKHVAGAKADKKQTQDYIEKVYKIKTKTFDESDACGIGIGFLAEQNVSKVIVEAKKKPLLKKRSKKMNKITMKKSLPSTCLFKPKKDDMDKKPHSNSPYQEKLFREMLKECDEVLKKERKNK